MSECSVPTTGWGWFFWGWSMLSNLVVIGVCLLVMGAITLDAIDRWRR